MAHGPAAFGDYWRLFLPLRPFNFWLGEVLLETPQVVLIFCVYFYYFFRDLRGQFLYHPGRALVFRNYYNYYLRQREIYDTDFLGTTEDVLEDLPSGAAAFKEMSAQAKADHSRALAERIEKRQRMI